MAIGGLYQVKNPMDTAMQGMAQAAGTYGSMSRNTETKTEAAAKTIGGGAQSAAGGAVAGAIIGAEVGWIGGPWGAAAGAVIGGLAYMFS